jgi:hypothetical protein
MDQKNISMVYEQGEMRGKPDILILICVRVSVHPTCWIMDSISCDWLMHLE